jgi:enediyne biosynthesis protein E4
VQHSKIFFLTFVLTAVFLSCSQKKQDAIFKIVEKERTNIDFRNDLKSYDEFNMFKYMYFFNGAGVGTGDFNNDGLVDLFFTSNQGQNKIYRNAGNLKFEDITTLAQVPQDSAWNTGVSIADVNADGLLDIYICRVGNFDILQSKNQLLICNGIKDGVPTYSDKAHEYGVDFSTFSTQAAFLDYDLDGDLDMYLMNHSLRYNGTFYEKSKYEGTFDTLAGDRLLKLENGVYIDVTKKAGISGNIISYGLGLCVADINVDGFPDIYVGNDFHENDYMYLNNGDGTFTDKASSSLDCTSQFSMGVDVGDINNDALPEIITMDMLPSDPYLLRRSLGDDSYDLFNTKLAHGYQHQYARNTLQLNLGNEQFSEIGRYSNVFNTDWSWSPIFTDFDNDGWRDLFISNGIPKRMNDIDYIKFISNDKIQEQIKRNIFDKKDLALVDEFPEIKIENRFLMNAKDLTFSSIDDKIENNKKSFSNGAIAADLDNDGDQDIVVNNINDYAFIYENQTNVDTTPNHWVNIKLSMEGANYFAIGSKVIVYSDTTVRMYENFPTKGFMSSTHDAVHVGLGSGTIDSMLLVWPDQSYERIKIEADNSTLEIKHRKGLPHFNYSVLHPKNRSPFVDITAECQMIHRHYENPFVEFDREPLMPHMVSREGPALCVGDINGDALDDIFIGDSKDIPASIYIQSKAGTFGMLSCSALIKHSKYEDVAAEFVDVNGDKSLDLIVASGGNEFSLQNEAMLPRVYLNDGRGNFNYFKNAIPDAVKLNASCIAAFDYNADGKIDLFFGGRSVPYSYGAIPVSYLLINDGDGRFSVDINASNSISSAGFITDAKSELNKDGKFLRLIFATEWSGIYEFSKKDSIKRLTSKNGWWNTTQLADIDLDGDVDILAGNLGQNTKLKVSADKPLTMYYGDFDKNGTNEQLISYYYGGSKIPLNNYEELLKQIPSLKKKYIKAADFAKAGFDDLFPANKISSFEKYELNYTANSVLSNNNGKYDIAALPLGVQFSTLKDIRPFDLNHDKYPDFLCAGNYFHNNVQLGNDDASPCTILVGKVDGKFEVLSLKSLVKGEVRKIRKIIVNRKEAFILAKNNELQIIASQ